MLSGAKQGAMLAATLAKRVQALRVAQALIARQRTTRALAPSQRSLSTRKPREKLYSITGTTQGTTSTSQTRGHTLKTDTPPSGGGKDTESDGSVTQEPVHVKHGLYCWHALA